jgi:putative transposase
MPRHSPYHVALSRAEAQEPDNRAAKYTLPYFQDQRAKMILLAAQGLANHEIAARLDAPREAVSMCRKRFFERRLAGLDEQPRPGRPRAFPPRTGRADQNPGP